MQLERALSANEHARRLAAKREQELVDKMEDIATRYEELKCVTLRSRRSQQLFALRAPLSVFASVEPTSLLPHILAEPSRVSAPLHREQNRQLRQEQPALAEGGASNASELDVRDISASA